MSGDAKKPAIADAGQRARALDPTRSFVVQAPAGSGKTGLLVLRFLALLARVDRPEAVLAITFTRKAAGEMRRRIVDALLDAAARDTPPDDDFERDRWARARAALARDAERGWQLLHSPSRLQVFTIDSFCSRVVAGTPLLSRLGSTPQVVDDPAALYREAVRRTLSSAGRSLLGEHLEVLLERYEMGLDRLEDQLVEMLGRREQWRAGARKAGDDEDAWVTAVEAAFADAIADEVASIATGAQPGVIAAIHQLALVSRDAAGGDCAWPTLGEKHRLGAGVDAAPAWKQAAAMLLISDGKSLRKQAPKDPSIKPAFQAVRSAIEEDDSVQAWSDRLRAATKLPAGPVFGDDGRVALRAFLAVLRHAWGELFHVFRERREVDHGEVAMGAVQALEPGETLEKLDARLEHVLIDEFQDTNVLQYELLRGLTEGWQRDDGRTVFLVGDPMQSIYRFRKAEVGLFLAARSQPTFLPNCDLEPLALSVNFRSTTTLVGWVNGAFRTLLGDRDDAVRSRVAFAPAAPSPKAADGPEPDFVVWTTDQPVDDNEADAAEAAGLADLIADEAARARAARAVQAAADGKKTESHAAPVAVLVRARTHAQPLLRALEARHPRVLVRAPGLDKLAQRPTAIDLEALLRALLHPGDRLSWLALLRSRWIGLSVADLSALVEHDVAAAGGGHRATPVPVLLRDAAALARVGDDTRSRVQRLLAVVDAARRDLSSRRLDVALRSAWLRLGGPAGGPDATATDALDAEAFFDLVAERSRGGRLDLDDFARALADTEAPVDAEADVDVEIMTMHKAKGLEFDTVVLPALGRGTGGGSTPPLAMETEHDSGRLTLIAPRGARGRDDGDKDKYDFLQAREKRRGESETLRLLYVAATRARRRLVLSACAARLNKDGSASAGSLLGAMKDALDPTTAREVASPPPVARAGRALLRFPTGHALGAAPRAVADRSVVAERPSEHGPTTPEMFPEGRAAAQAGTVFHAFAERISHEGLDAWPEERVRAEAAAVRHALRAEGMLPSELDAATARVIDALVATVGDERGRWILAPHAGARSEWSVMGWDGRRLTSAQIDRTFVDDGVRWILDFKTGTLPDDVPEAEHVKAKRSGYRPQLARYAQLLQELEPGVPVRLGLWFPEWPAPLRWQDVTDEDEAVPA